MTWLWQNQNRSIHTLDPDVLEVCYHISKTFADKGIHLRQALISAITNIHVALECCIKTNVFWREHFLSGCPPPPPLPCMSQPSASSSGYCRFTQVTGGCLSGQAAPDGCQRTPLNFTTHLWDKSTQQREEEGQKCHEGKRKLPVFSLFTSDLVLVHFLHW